MSFWRNRNVFITGCTGFLGSTLTAELVDRGANVVGLVRDVVPEARFFSDGTADRVTCVRGSLEDYDLVERAINEYAIDTVFHLGAQAIVGVANRNPLSTFEANIKGTWVVLEACRRNTTVGRVVVASSDKAYGDHDVLPYEEHFPLQGRHPYDVSKSCADLIALSYHETYRLPVAITRCGNLFGPGDTNTNRIVPGTILSALAGERPVIRSDGTPVRDYVYVDDIVTAYLMLAEQLESGGHAGQAFNFGTGEPVSVLDLTLRTLAAVGRPDLKPVIENNAHGEIQRQYLSSKLANSKLGWAPGASLDERLRDTADWYKQRMKAAA
jgi:CDP-glucose 4,6-dehydratase